MRLALALAAALALPLPCLAQDRPSEDELFGSPPAGDAAPQSPPGVEPSRGAPEPEASPDVKPAERPVESELFGSPASSRPGAAEAPSAAGALERALREETLAIGGQLYLRAFTNARQTVPPSEWSLSAPFIADGFLDARPNDRVRGLLLARMRFDSTVDPTPDAGSATALFAGGSGGPDVFLDQLWVRFDVARSVFVTAGRQHVRWGTGRFWTPTDFLYPIRRDPLARFDVRTGITMLKLHLPVESRAWNFYAVGLLDGAEASNELGRLGAAARAELVFGQAELGADALVRRGERPKFGIDLSAGIWDLDVHGELLLKTGSDATLIRECAPGRQCDLVQGRYEIWRPDGLTPQAVAGVEYSVKYSDEDAVVFGGEYFWNALGYDDPELYPVLVAHDAFGAAALRGGAPAGTLAGDVGGGSAGPTGDGTLGTANLAANPAFTPFYLGRHYGGLYASLPSPGRWNDTTITFSTLGNLSDASFVSRVDWQVRVLTYLRVEAFGAVYYGTKGGEFRFEFDVPPDVLALIRTTAPADSALGAFARDFRPIRNPLFDVGVGVRVDL